MKKRTWHRIYAVGVLALMVVSLGACSGVSPEVASPVDPEVARDITVYESPT